MPRLLPLLLALALTGAAGVHAAAQDPPPRPNIVLIMADDMGFSDIGCYGGEIRTPSLDRLAAGGLRFTQFYNAARCCPTRASLLTGLYPHQAGVGHMVGNHGAPAYQGYLNDRCVTLAEILGETGYHTWMSGKWHVGETRPHWPVDRGFQRSYTLISGGTNYFRLDPGRKMAINDRPHTPDEDGFYLTDAFTENALRFLDEHAAARDTRDRPFFLYLPYTAPHWPLHARPEEIARYRGRYRDGWDALRETRHRRMLEMGIVEKQWPLTPRDPAAPAWSGVEDRDAWDLKMAVYAAQIERMDHGIGRIMDRIRALGRQRNTLVLFLADNGGCAEVIDRGTPGAPPGPKESFLSYGLAWANASNTPFREYKHWVHEGGIATPLIVSWPAVIGKGGLTHRPGHLVDVMPTLLEAAGARYPREFRGRAVQPAEGVSLLPILRGGRTEGERTLYWEHEGNRAVRRGKWKLVSRHAGQGPGPWELYDLDADRTETRDLAPAQPRRVGELRKLYERWAERCGVLPWSGGRPRVPGR